MDEYWGYRKYGVINSRGLDRLHHFSRAGSAAGMQQQFVGTVWQGKLRADKGGCTHRINSM